MEKEEAIKEELKDKVKEELHEDLQEETTEKVEEESNGKEESTESLEKIIADYENRLLRLQADFDNFRKRTVKEKEEIYKYSLSDFMEKLLPVIDNMERAIESVEKADIDDPYAGGVKMVLDQLFELLKNQGLKEIESVDAQFDPNYHHGVSIEDVEDVADNQILEVFQKGYQFKDKVIRPAMVKICKK